MKNNAFSILLLSLWVWGCSDLAEPSSHPIDWLKPESENSHMAKIASSGIEGCQPCHGGYEKNDYFGGSSGVSCYTCHAGGPSGHPEWTEWMDKNSKNYHGTAYIEKGQDYCFKCHLTKTNNKIIDFSCQVCHTNWVMN